MSTESRSVLYKVTLETRGFGRIKYVAKIQDEGTSPFVLEESTDLCPRIRTKQRVCGSCTLNSCDDTDNNDDIYTGR